MDAANPQPESSPSSVQPACLGRDEQCPLCGGEVKLNQFRGHVGKHILFHSRGMSDRLLQEVRVLVTQRRLLCSHVHQIGDDPCGFCSASGCTTRLIIQGKKRQVESNCIQVRLCEEVLASVTVHEHPDLLPALQEGYLEIQRSGPHHR